MTRLWLMLGAAIVMAFIIEYRDAVRHHLGYRSREKVVTWLLIVSMAVFSGLRIWGNDTSEYLDVYEYLTPTFDTYNATKHAPSFADGWLFKYINIALKSFGFSNQNYLMFFAFVTVIPYVLFVRKFSCNIVWGVFLMFATGFYTFSMAAIKQSLAIGICLMSIPYAINKSWIRFSLTVVFASLFHPYALVYFVVPLMMFQPWKGQTILYVALFIVAGFALDMFIGTLVDVTTMLGAEYSYDELSGEGVNLLRVLVCLVPMILAVFFGGDLFEKASPAEHLMFNLAMINGLIMFVGLFGTANYFARLANYFLPFQVVTLPWMIRSGHARDRRWLIPAAIAGYLGYFYYEYGILRPFDTKYAQMSLIEYLTELFR